MTLSTGFVPIHKSLGAKLCPGLLVGLGSKSPGCVFGGKWSTSNIARSNGASTTGKVFIEQGLLGYARSQIDHAGLSAICAPQISILSIGVDEDASSSRILTSSKS